MMKGRRCVALLLALLALLAMGATQQQAEASRDTRRSTIARAAVKAVVPLRHMDHPDSPLRLNESNYMSLWGQRNKNRVFWLHRELQLHATASSNSSAPQRQPQPQPQQPLPDIPTESILSGRPEFKEHFDGGNPRYYTLDITVGRTPAGDTLTQTVVVDFMRDISWVQCQACSKCLKQKQPLYDPLKSITFGKVPCHDWRCNLIEERRRSCERKTNSCKFDVFIADEVRARGYLGVETVGLAGWEHEDVVLGCSTVTSNSGGLVNEAGQLAFGRGALSIPSMYGTSFGNIFALCVTRMSKDNGYLRLGGVSGPTTVRMLTQPLRNIGYWLPLVGLSVNNEALPVKPSVFEMDPSAKEVTGVILDDITHMTLFPDATYKLLRDAIRKTLDAAGIDHYPSQYDFWDTCFLSQSFNDLTKVTGLPTVQLHFDDDVTISLDTYNVFNLEPHIQRFGAFSPLQDAYCLMFSAQYPGLQFSIIGNVQMRGFEWSFDHDLQEIGIARGACDPHI